MNKDVSGSTVNEKGSGKNRGEENRLLLGLRLFLTFFKIGAFTFGGGYAMIPLIPRETAEKHGWVSDEDILEIVAVAESTPGPIAINAATFVGCRVCGFLGALCATLGVVLPSFVIILAVSGVLREFREIKAVQYAFQGVRAGVLALLVKSLHGMYKKNPGSPLSYIIMALAFVLTAFCGVGVLPVIICSGIIGLAVSLAKERRAAR